MATHSSTLAWKIPWMEEPGGLKSMESQRVGRDPATSLSFLSFSPAMLEEESNDSTENGADGRTQFLLVCVLKIYEKRLSTLNQKDKGVPRHALSPPSSSLKSAGTPSVGCGEGRASPC